MALVVTVMALTAVLALSGALLPLVSTETAIAANHLRAVQLAYLAEGLLEWVALELRAAPSLDAALRGPASRPAVVQLADGTSVDLRQLTRDLIRRGAGSGGAGRGLGWRLYAHGPVEAFLSRDPTRGVLFGAVWLADDRLDPDGDPGRDANRALEAHAMVVGPAHARRAVQATIRLSPGSSGSVPVVSIGPWRLVR